LCEKMLVFTDSRVDIGWGPYNIVRRSKCIIQVDGITSL